MRETPVSKLSKRSAPHPAAIAAPQGNITVLILGVRILYRAVTLIQQSTHRIGEINPVLGEIGLLFRLIPFILHALSVCTIVH